MALGPRDYTNPNIFYSDKLRFMENSVLAFLQSLFSTFPAAGSTEIMFNCFHYDHDDSDKTEINIEGAGTDNLNTVDNRPKIVVSRGPVSFQQPGINASIGSQSTSMRTQRHATIMTGSVGISCYSRESLEADRIAEICASSIEAFQPIIRQYGFLEIRTAQIGQRAMIKSDARPELFVTPVMLKTSVTANWNRTKVDPVLLRKIILQVQANPGNLNISTTVIKKP